MAETDHPPGEPETVKVQDFRARMKEHFTRDHGMIVGSYWNARAVVIPVPPRFGYAEGDKKSSRAKMRRWFESCLEKLGQ